MFDAKAHWENIYSTKPLNEFSWYQEVPQTSLDFLREFRIAKDAKIIDVGGGDSLFVDHLLSQGYTAITVLDISAHAIERAKQRLGEKAGQVKWIVANASKFVPAEQYDFWHDRAVFHFLTNEADIANYIDVIHKGLKKGGALVVGTFSEQGPKKCSGIEVHQYSEQSLTERLQEHFSKVRCISVDHVTPFNTVQNFVFCSFKVAA